MKKRSFVLIGAMVFAGLLFSLSGQAEWNGSGRYVELDAGDGPSVLENEEFYVVLPAWKSIPGEVFCKVERDVITYLGYDKTPAGKLRLGFKAVYGGKTRIAIRIGKSKPDFYKVSVLNVGQVPLINVSDLKASPKDYKHKIFRLFGSNRGWGAAEKAGEVWGAHVTRSDWIFEDDTGAINVTGAPLPSGSKLTLVAYLTRFGKEWAVNSVLVMPVVEYKDPGKPDLTLDFEKLNTMKVGQVGLIEVNPSRSHLFDYVVTGNAVVAVGGNRDELLVKAVQEGESRVEIYLRFFYEDIHPHVPGTTPSMVVKIKVQK